MRSTTLTKKSGTNVNEKKDKKFIAFDSIAIIKSIRFISLFGINYLIYSYVALPWYDRLLVAIIINICVFNISVCNEKLNRR